MSGGDIHPEDLLDKMAAGTLSEAEHEHLTAHLNDCEVCRFTLDVHDDLELEATGLEFGRVSAHRLLGLTSEVAQPSIPPRRRPRRPILIAVGVFAVASGAAALVGSGHLPWTEASVAEPSARPPIVMQGTPRAAPARRAKVAPAPEPTAEEAKEPVVEHEATKPSAGQPQSASSDATAAELFASANEARRNANVAQATRLYHQLQRRFPTSAEAQLSLVTLGRLQLDSGNASAALSTFTRYLARGGRPLEVEALYGRALALGRLGMSAQEQQAWRALINKHPGSGYANKARERLRALAAR